MFGIGFTEILVLAIIALVVVGPEKLPGLAQKVGRFAWEMRRAWDDVRDTVRTEMLTIKQPFDEIRSSSAETRDYLRDEARKLTGDTKEAMDSLTKDAREAFAKAGQKKAKISEEQGEPKAPSVTSTDETAASGAKPFQPAAPRGAAAYYDLDGNRVEPEDA